MDRAMPVALFLALVLAIIAVVSIRGQVRQLRELRSGVVMASDDRRYLRNRSYRRIINGVIMILLGGMLAGSYLSGMEARATEIAELADQAVKAGQPRERDQEERDFVRFYSAYWIGILLLLFLIMSMAVVDFWATRKYGLSQLKRIREDQQAMLRRDLEMYRQQRQNDRMRSSDS